MASSPAQLAQPLATPKPRKKYIRFLTADSSIDPAIEAIASGTVRVFDLRRLLEYSDLPGFDLQSYLRRMFQGYWHYPTTDGKLKLRQSSPEEMEDCVGYFIEGTSTIAELLLEDHVRAGRKVAESTVGQWEGKVELVDFNGKPLPALVDKHGQPGLAHFGNVQRYVLNTLVPESLKLPVHWVIWTGHETRGEDKETGVSEPIFGPQMVGKAGIKQLQRAFGNCIHLDWVGRGAERKRVAFYDNHPDPDNPSRNWVAKVSVATPLRRRMDAKWRNKDGLCMLPLTDEHGIDLFFRERAAWMSTLTGTMLDLERSKPVTTLIYGDSNTGKTLQLAHMAKLVDELNAAAKAADVAADVARLPAPKA